MRIGVCSRSQKIIGKTINLLKKWYNIVVHLVHKPEPQYYYGGVKVSTGVWNQEKRAVVCQVYVKNGTLNINAKNNNNYALAA